MNDFEKQLSDRLNEAVDAKVGRRSPAPTFVPAAVSRGRQAKRWMAIAAALVIVALGTGGAYASGVLRGTGPQIGATPTPVPSASSTPTDTPTATETPSAMATPSVSTTPSRGPVAAPTSSSSKRPSTSAPATGKMVTLGGQAQIFVPAGWKVYPGRVGGEADLPGKETWCISRSDAECDVMLTQVGDGADRPNRDFVSPLFVGGFIPTESIEAIHYACDEEASNNAVKVAQTTVDEKSFGGRAAEHVVWRLGCPNTTATTVYFEQYVVPTYSSWIMLADLRFNAVERQAEVSQAMAQIAAKSVLPAQQGKVRLTEVGRVTALSGPNAAGDMTVTLDRKFQDAQFDEKIIDSDQTTYTYTVPSQAYACDEQTGECPLEPAVGKLVWLTANKTGTTLIAMTGDDE